MLKQSSLAIEEPLWQALLEAAGEGIWGVDLQGDCTFVNRAAIRMLGFTSEELLGHNMHEMVHHHYPDGRVYPRDESVVYKVFLKKEPFANHTDHIFRKDGTMFWAELSAQPIVVDNEMRGAVVSFRDVTLSRLAEEALRRSEKLAAVGQLASSIAHEINNPLEAVINLLYLVRTADSINDARTYALMAESEAARMADITMQTLRFHKQQSLAVATDLNELVAAVLRLYTSRVLSRKIILERRLWPTLAAMVFEGDLRQVLNNIIRNAYDVMPAGGDLHVRLRNSHSPSTGEAGVRITIADTGSGFLPKMREHLFEPFHTSKEITGTGLGLWISKGIMDKHRGEIRMRSRLQRTGETSGYGTVFSLWLPLVA